MLLGKQLRHRITEAPGGTPNTGQRQSFVVFFNVVLENLKTLNCQLQCPFSGAVYMQSYHLANNYNAYLFVLNINRQRSLACCDIRALLIRLDSASKILRSLLLLDRKLLRVTRRRPAA